MEGLQLKRPESHELPCQQSTRRRQTVNKRPKLNAQARARYNLTFVLAIRHPIMLHSRRLSVTRNLRSVLSSLINIELLTCRWRYHVHHVLSETKSLRKILIFANFYIHLIVDVIKLR